MIVFQPNALYTRQDLADLLHPIGINPDSFVARIRPAKRFRMAWWGADLIAAIDAAPAMEEDADSPSSDSQIASRGDRQRAARCSPRDKAVAAMTAPLRRLRAEVEES